MYILSIRFTAGNKKRETIYEEIKELPNALLYIKSFIDNTDLVIHELILIDPASNETSDLEYKTTM